MRSTFLLALLFSFSVCGAAQAPSKKVPTLREMILPKSLQKVEFGKTSEGEITKSLGAPKKKASAAGIDTYFYNLTGKDFDMTVAFKNKKLLYIIYSPDSPKVSFKDLGDWVSTEDLVKVVKANSAKISAEKGREIQIEKKNLGASFTFSDNRDMTLKSVLVWKEGEPLP